MWIKCSLCTGFSDVRFVYVPTYKPYLVELKFFNKVEFVFYVRGHTKNDCDHLFNQLKLRWHKTNTYTMEQMVDCLNTQPHVTFVEVKADIFKDYGTLFSSFYNQFPPGSIQKNHIFWVDSTNSTTMMMKISHDVQSTVRHNLKKKMFQMTIGSGN